MMAATYYPVGVRPVVSAVVEAGDQVARIGHMVAFFFQTLASVPLVLRRYPREFFRLLSDVTWGNGSIVVGGGTAGVVLINGAAGGAVVAIEGYNALNLLGLGPATGLITALASVREIAPMMASLGFAIQAGCRFTAQLGAMRISEEIDALESVAIRPIPFLVTTRVLASALAVVPLFVVCLCLNFLVCQFVIFLASGQGSGTYLHYFGLMLSARDMAFAVIKVAVFVTIMSTLQCYYGYYASGGPRGVGIAAGRAMRASITVMVSVNMLLTMAFWGVDAGGRLGG
ncbi:ABC transporter permease [Mycobacterium intermedium]|uniref:ABC transporter permease n=1 Tax=Mycobacterium intermedium TaxID=28445 RepID=A0A1E3SMW8_MYCIE|nr:ABC transporter permease [Mycobacterium intermedium]ODR02973.1 ABC transporter permease [Mycobacterium intermedium]OPE49939.1 ABC transporter permease [Mycobacterium intermedium]ORB02792.1 ABC transporter permease [Mycobacterium intermedium]